MESKPALCKAVNAALGSELFSADKVSAARGGVGAGCCWNRCNKASTEYSICAMYFTTWCTYAAELRMRLAARFSAARQVAKALVGGIERGDYHLPSPDLGQNLLVSAMTGLRCGCMFLFGLQRLGRVVQQEANAQRGVVHSRGAPTSHTHAVTHPPPLASLAPLPAPQSQALLAAAADAAGSHPAAHHLAVWLDRRPCGTAAQPGARHATAGIQLIGLPS